MRIPPCIITAAITHIGQMFFEFALTYFTFAREIRRGNYIVTLQ